MKDKIITKHFTSIIMYKLLSLLLLAAIAGGCGNGESQVPEEEVVLPGVKTRVISTEIFTEAYRIVGVVKPYASVTLASEEGGLITYLAKDKGDRIGRGETVVRLKKDTDFASYNQSLAQLELAKSNFERVSRLYEEKVVTEQEYTNARLNLEIAERSVGVIQTRLSKSTVRSPISGVVEQRFMDRGEVSGPGTPIISVVDVSKVKITAGIPERYINDVTKGSKVRVTFDVLPGEVYEGVVSYASPVLSSTNRTFEIEIVIDNKSGKLKPEMSANIEVTKLSIPSAIVLPQDLIVDYGEEKYVFVLEGGVAKKRVVTLGGRDGNNVLILTGLIEGDKLIVEGFQSLTEGDAVKEL